MTGTAHKSRYEEFSAYVSDRGPALLRMARSLANNSSEAEDLLQAALIKTFFAWDRIASPNARDGYVRRAMVNTQISEWRRQHMSIYPTSDIPDQRIEDPTWKTDLADSVHRAISRLPDRQRTMVVLRYYQDMTEVQIADRLGVTLGTVKSTLSRAVNKLRQDADLTIDRATT
ncbi:MULTISPECIES: SigE family RNA polymerase sigma factor [Streptomonospora]|uniref:SigE family RNA polymerase sigma factor n=2 Tax=Streptomonospora TaxID=104204 RepID=A0ABV9SSV1_9ACTN